MRKVFGFVYLVAAVLSLAPPAGAQAPLSLESDPYVLFANTSLRAIGGGRILDGDLGVNDGTFQVLPRGLTDASSSTIRANLAIMDDNLRCAALFANTTSGTPCKPPTAFTSPLVADFAAACGAPNPFPSCETSAEAIALGPDQARTLSAGSYGAVSLRAGAVLTLAGGEYTFCSLKVGPNARVIAAAPTTLTIAGSLRLSDGAHLVPTDSLSANDLHVSVGTAGILGIHRQARATARLCAPKARLRISDAVQLVGSFAADTIYLRRVKARRGELPPVPTTTTTTATSTSSTTASSSTTTTATTTTTTIIDPCIEKCGNGVIDDESCGEICDTAVTVLCDPSSEETRTPKRRRRGVENGSATGAFCEPGCKEIDRSMCPATTTTTIETTSTTTVTTTTATTVTVTTTTATTVTTTTATTVTTTTATTVTTTTATTVTTTTVTTVTTTTATTVTTTTVTTVTTTTATTVTTTTVTTVTTTTATTVTTTTVTTVTTTTATTVTTTTVTTVTTTTATTTTTTSSTTTTTGGFTRFSFTTVAGSPACGGPSLNTPIPAAPFSGAVFNSTGTFLRSLGSNCLYLGSGGASVPNNTNGSGTETILDIVSNAAGVLTVGPSAGTNGFTCSQGPLATKHCVNNPAVTCTTDANCAFPTVITGACQEDPRCNFGAPIPVNALVPACAVNNIVNNPAAGGAAGIGGTVNQSTGQTTLTVPLRTYTYLTPPTSVTQNEDSSPCPQCKSGTCRGGRRNGQACSGALLNLQCLPNHNEYAGPISVTLGPLTTGNSSMSAPVAPGTATDGLFCPSQSTKGAFGITVIRRVDQTGAGPGSLVDGLPHNGILTSTFCIPASPNATLNAQAGLPGPGAVSITAAFKLF